MNKKIAPYGINLAQKIIADQSYKIVIICMGKNSWELSKSIQSFYPFILCLPPNKSPSNFDWPLLGCEVKLVDTGMSHQSFISFCAQYFLMEGAIYVQYVSSDQILSYRKEF